MFIEHQAAPKSPKKEEKSGEKKTFSTPKVTVHKQTNKNEKKRSQD